jgi:hypothetical protein
LNGVSAARRTRLGVTGTSDEHVVRIVGQRDGVVDAGLDLGQVTKTVVLDGVGLVGDQAYGAAHPART